ncbi:MAG: helix-turn-helix transcriptional regulator [Erysipelotrichaceae bacterium]
MLSTNYAVLYDFARNMKTIRIEKNISLVKLANLTGLHINFLCKVEKAQSNPSLYSMYKIATALNIRLIDLLDVRDIIFDI